MKTIIAPTDFSNVSLNAVNYAADLAAAINAELILVNVVQIPVTVSELPLTEFEYDEMTEEAEQELAVITNQLYLRTKNKIKIHSKMVVGSVGHELEEICKRRKPFAVVMGTKGAGAAERFFIGSNTIFAVNKLEYPVLVVPQNATFKGIRKILLAFDLKETVPAKPIEFLKQWLQIFKGKLDVINVVDSGRIKPGTLPAEIALQDLLPEFQPAFHYINGEDVEDGVYRFVEENHPNLLVIIPREHGIFSGLFHKSKSKPFILHPHIPVLAVSE